MATKNNNVNPLQDIDFLKALDVDNLKVYYIKIIVLDRNEVPIRPIEGRISAGSISINGNSAVRRAGSVTFVAEEGENDLTDIDNLLSINKRIKILIGLENHITTDYPDIIWFNQGIFVISKPNLQHNLNGVTISLQFKDKMCLLNGEAGGNLPTSIIFHEYDQVIGFDDNSGQNSEYYFDTVDLRNNNNDIYLHMPGDENEELDEYYSRLILENPDIFSNNNGSLVINPPGLAGYHDFPKNPNSYTVYLVVGKYYMWSEQRGWYEVSASVIGTTVTVKQRIFDIIQTLVCNYGNEDIAKIIINDVPLELKASVRHIGSNPLYYNQRTGIYTYNSEETYLNPGEWHTYSYNEDCGYVYTDFIYPGDLTSSIGDNVCTILDKIISVLGNYEYFYDVEGNFVFQEKKNYLNTSYDPTYLSNNDSSILNGSNYQVDFSHHKKSVYTFEEGSSLITSYSNSPNYERIKNDYHVWGKNQDGMVIHYHLAIKEKPVMKTGRNPDDIWWVIPIKNADGEYTGQIRLATDFEIDQHEAIMYTADDWRAEVYLQALEKQKNQIRPDIYEQEILDLFDGIYNMLAKEYKTDLTTRPNELTYWIDYLVPENLHYLSTDTVGTKIYSYQKDKIIKLYNTEIPDVVMIDSGFDEASQAYLIKRCEEIGQPYARVPHSVYTSISVGTVGYTAQETMRDLLYQYTDYMSTISLSSIPIYYLDVNTRITVHDKSSGITGDYIINSINLPLDAKNTMTISASRALDREMSGGINKE